MGVRQLPSRAVRKARSHTIASRVSSWFRVDRYCAAASSPSRHAMPMAPCTDAQRMLLAEYRGKCVAHSFRFLDLHDRGCGHSEDLKHAAEVGVARLARSAACAWRWQARCWLEHALFKIARGHARWPSQTDVRPQQDTRRSWHDALHLRIPGTGGRAGCSTRSPIYMQLANDSAAPAECRELVFLFFSKPKTVINEEKNGINSDDNDMAPVRQRAASRRSSGRRWPCR